MTDIRCWGSRFTDHDIMQTRALGGLLTMELELSHACNLRCIYCYAASGEPLPNELDYDEIIGAIDQAQALGARRIIVLGGGEPLAYPRILDVLKYIAARRLEIELFTNGTLLNSEIVTELLRLRVHPVIKFNSMIPEIQDTLAGRKGTHAAIQNNFNLLLNSGYPGDLSLGAQTVICSHNYKELPAMWLWLRRQNIIPYFETITMQGRAREHANLVVSTGALRELFDELARIDRDLFDIHWEAKPPVAAFTCRRHLFSCTITATGDVLPCPGVTISAGNIRQAPLSSILHQSKVFNELRNIHQTIKGHCRICDLSHECYGCRGMAYQISGDYLAADPLCWRAQSLGEHK